MAKRSTSLFTATQIEPAVGTGGGGGGGITSLNALTGSSQSLVVGTTGSDFNISSSGSTHTFHLPTASSSVRGALSTSDWGIFNGKQNALPTLTNGQIWQFRSGALTATQVISKTDNTTVFDWSGTRPLAALGLVLGSNPSSQADTLVVTSSNAQNASFRALGNNTGPSHIFFGTDNGGAIQQIATWSYPTSGGVASANLTLNGASIRFRLSWDGSDYGTYFENKQVWFGNTASPVTSTAAFINVGKDSGFPDALAIWQAGTTTEQVISWKNSANDADGFASYLEDNTGQTGTRVAGLNLGVIGDSTVGFVVNNQVWLRVDSGGTFATDGAGTDVFRINTNGVNEWYATSAFQTTVGAAGSASALPALPREYLIIMTPSGAGVIPVYNQV